MPIQPLESANLRVITDNTGRMVDIIDAQGDSIGVVGSKANEITGWIKTSPEGITNITQRFTDFSPSILASLVVGATYGQSGTLVTVTATAHGLPTSRNGYRIFWPGSAAIAAGWYGDFSYVDANTYTFQNPSAQTVTAGTAITGTLPYINQAAVCSLIVPGGAMNKRSELITSLLRSGDTTSGSKTVQSYFGGVLCAQNVLTTSPTLKLSFSISAVDTGKIVYSTFPVMSSTAAINFSNLDLTVDALLEIRASVQSASMYVTIDNAGVDFIK